MQQKPVKLKIPRRCQIKLSRRTDQISKLGNRSKLANYRIQPAQIPRWTGLGRPSVSSGALAVGILTPFACVLLVSGFVALPFHFLFSFHFLFPGPSVSVELPRT